jgi:uncharacterized protein YjbJ (UPF0337 family)
MLALGPRARVRESPYALFAVPRSSKRAETGNQPRSFPHETEGGSKAMADRTQRLRGKANEAGGKAKANAGYATGSKKTEGKGVGKALKGKTQQATGKARSAAKKSTR